MKLRRVTHKLIKVCPRCGSGDVRMCNISIRPYCNECHYWAPVNYGNEQHAIIEWNNFLMSYLAIPCHEMNLNGKSFRVALERFW